MMDGVAPRTGSDALKMRGYDNITIVGRGGRPAMPGGGTACTVTACTGRTVGTG